MYSSWSIPLMNFKQPFAVNTELIRLYWEIGNEILKRQEELGWGAKVIPQLSKDLMAEFPEMKGFSVTNLKYLRMFAMAWGEDVIGQRGVDQIVQLPVAQLPWRHNIALLEKIDTTEERLSYAKLSLENAWSKDVLVHQIEMQTAKRIGKATTNFKHPLAVSTYELEKLGLPSAKQLQEGLTKVL